ncbi:MAG: SDR family NAD(P)-dependent oxidoreductase [Acidimicrobiia bacterium]
MEINGAVAFVTGAASGLGEATARHLASLGATVVVCDFNADRGTQVAKEIKGVFAHTDVTNDEQVAAAVALATEIGPLRIAVNCAGIGSISRTIDRNGAPHSRDEWARTIGINLTGTFLCLTREAEAIAKGDPIDADGQRGVIVNTASVAAYEGQIGQLAYSASKGGVVGITMPAARDLAVVGIRVMTIAPGLVDTPLLGMLPDPAREALGQSVVFPKRLAKPTEYARTVQMIVENNYLNGEVIRMDGAIRMQPK